MSPLIRYQIIKLVKMMLYFSSTLWVKKVMNILILRICIETSISMSITSIITSCLTILSYLRYHPEKILQYLIWFLKKTIVNALFLFNFLSKISAFIQFFIIFCIENFNHYQKFWIFFLNFLKILSISIRLYWEKYKVFRSTL